MIIGPAIKKDDIIFSLKKPKRHHDVIKYMIEEFKIDVKNGEQGFITHDNKFLNRKEAAEYVLKRKDITKLSWPPLLYSEDLW
jgi:hypothetical protein